MNLNLSRSLRWLILIGILLIPFIALIVANSMFFPFITGKAFTFRILIEILAGLWLILMLISPEHRPKSSLLLWAVLSLLTALTISTIFSVNPDRSFWSNFERMEGLVSLIYLAVCLFLLQTFFKEKKDWLFYIRLILISSCLVSLYGLAQKFNILPVFEAGIGRMTSTIGNAAFLAGYSLLAFGLSVYYYLNEPDKNYKYFALTASSLNLIVLLLTSTRGAILGLSLGIFVFIFFIKDSPFLL